MNHFIVDKGHRSFAQFNLALGAIAISIKNEWTYHVYKVAICTVALACITFRQQKHECLIYFFNI